MTASLKIYNQDLFNAIFFKKPREIRVITELLNYF